MNPMLLCEALKRSALAAGARFVPEARVGGFEQSGSRITGVHTTAGDFAAGAVVNAAGAWAARISRLAGAEVPIAPVRGQIVCTETLPQRTLRHHLSTADCYVLQKSHGEILIGSTTEQADFSTEVCFADVCRLAAGAARAVPALRGVHVKRCWAGLRPGTPDELPILGPSPECANLHYATGGFRTGIVSAPLSAEIVAACLLGQTPPLPLDPFRADRFGEPARIPA